MSEKKSTDEIYSDFKISFNELLSQLDDTFPKEFVSNGEAEETPSISTIIVDKVLEDEFTILFKSFFISYLEDINIQIIEGAFLDKEFRKIVNKIKNNLGEILDSLKIYFEYLKSNIFFQNLKKELEYCQKSLYFLNSITANLLYNKRTIRYQISSNNLELFDNILLDNNCVFKAIEILSYNIYLVKCDINLSIDNRDLITNIEQINLNLKVLSLETITDKFNDVIEILKSKSSFFKRKILLRKSQEIIDDVNNNDIEKEIYVLSKNEFTKFSSDKIVSSPSTHIFKDWLEYLNNHYELNESSKFNITKKVGVFPDDLLSGKFSTIEIHRLIKYFKDIHPKNEKAVSLKYLNKIKDYIVYKANLSENEFDKYAYKICLIYCYNNIFSFLETQGEDELLITQYEDYKMNKLVKGSKNYFVSGVILKYYTKKINQYFLSGDISKDIDSCSKYFKLSSDLIEKYYKEIEWSELHNNYIYSLPRNESSVTYKDIKVFVFSSFLLPIPKKYLDNKFKKVIEDLRFYQTSYKSVQSIKDNLTELKTISHQFQNLKISIDQKETRTLELVALIGSLLGFISGAIPGFNFINTGIEALWFTIALGSSLSFFAFVLYVINRGIEFLGKRWWLVLIYFIIVGSSWLSLYSTSNYFNEQKFNQSEIKEYIDSLNTNILNERDSLSKATINQKNIIDSITNKK